MYAIVDIAGQQFKVEKDALIKTQKVDHKVGSTVEFDKVLLLSGDKEQKIGSPYVDGAKIQAKVVEHGRDKKVIVFKKKRRKGYRVKNGHRQSYTVVKIESISQ